MDNFPLYALTPAPDITPTANGWYVRGAGDAAARFDSADGIICRVAPGADPDVVQLGIGAATSALCNTVYSPTSDTAVVFRADELRLAAADGGVRLTWNGPLTVTVLESYYRAHRGLAWFTPLDRTAFPRPPAGWCSWYEYYLNITEDEMVRNIDWLAEHLQPYGCEWVQIDDGWQGIGEGYGSNRDWFVTSARDFPRGMQWLADYIRQRNFRPGLWLIPVTQSDPALFAAQPEMFVRREDGTSAGETAWPVPEALPPNDDGKWVTWPGRYFIDPTSPTAHGYLTRLTAMVCDEWGYDYLKIDAQDQLVQDYQRFRRQRADPSLDGPRAMRQATTAIKSVLGPERFLLNCAQDYTSCGICQGIRTGGDIDLRTGWEGMQPAIEATLKWLWLNTTAFYTDPDVVCVREPLPLELARLWAALVGLTGQLLMTSDRMYALTEERVELLRRIYPVADIHPMELYPLDTHRHPGIFDVKVDLPGVGRWDVAALFNWSETAARTVALTPQRLGLDGEAWLCLDGWTGALLHDGDGALTVELPPLSSRVVSYWPRLGHPQVVGSNRHLTQGAVDLVSVAWNAEAGTLSGVSRVVGGEPYRLRVYVPAGYTPTSPQLEAAGALAELVLHSPQNAEIAWEIGFVF